MEYCSDAKQVYLPHKLKKKISRRRKKKGVRKKNGKWLGRVKESRNLKFVTISCVVLRSSSGERWNKRGRKYYL